MSELHTMTLGSARCTVRNAYPRTLQASMMCQPVWEGDILFFCWPAIQMFSADTYGNERTYRYFAG